MGNNRVGVYVLEISLEVTWTVGHPGGRGDVWEVGKVFWVQNGLLF